MEKNRILLAGEKKEGWKYSYFNNFLMATVMSLGTHELLLKIHKKIIIFSAFQSGLGHQV